MLTDEQSRRRWMGVLARAEADRIEAALPPAPAGWRFLRRPETGLCMVRGRVGGRGEPFNLGETTVTRCAVQLADGRVGHAYVQGRDARHAELAALADALLQDPAARPALLATLIDPLERDQRAAADRRRREAAATKVEFFTVAREAGA